jgi:hypothetical protein
MKMEKFQDWCDANPQSSRQEWVKNFKKMGWTEGAKFSTWWFNNQDHPNAKKFSFVLNTPVTTHPECWEE